MQLPDTQPALINRAYERLVKVIADGTVAPRHLPRLPRNRGNPWNFVCSGAPI
jgi:hypothetical protein